MITDYEKQLAQEALEEYDEAVRRHNEGMARKVLESALAFASPEATREEKLFHVCLTAANKIRMNDVPGALITLETGLRL